MSYSFWTDLQKQIDTLTAKAVADAAPRWRQLDLEAMVKSLPIVATRQDIGMGDAAIIWSEYVLREGVGLMTDECKRNLVWIPIPKVEVEK